ncbi:MAG: DUF2180 family protein [Hyphomicrobiales bacterium]|nr:DUF2180 family protein [Hyphomicrobiales bacterium]
MNCSNHSGNMAIGICIVCGRGLCSDCADDRGRGFACHGDHQDKLAERADLDRRRESLLSASEDQLRQSGVLRRMAALAFLFTLALVALVDFVSPRWDIFALAGGAAAGIAATAFGLRRRPKKGVAA